MSKFKDYLKIKWKNLEFRDKQIAITSAIKAAATVAEGSKIPADDLLKYADTILEHFFEFGELKPSYKDNPVADKVKKDENEIDLGDIPF